MHDALSWMGFVTDEEAAGWLPWLIDLAAQNRVVHADGRWCAVDGLTDSKAILLGRLEGLGPVFEDDPRIGLRGEEKTLLLELEKDGAILRTRLDGKTAWCERRLLARIHRSTIDRLRREIEPVSAGEFLQFLACWQHVDAEYPAGGPARRGRSADAARRIRSAGAGLGKAHILPNRVRDYQREWLDEVTMSGEFAWGRLWGGAGSAIRVTPIAIVPREQLDDWLSLAAEPNTKRMSGPAADLLAAMTAGGPMFPQSLPKAAKLVPAHVEMGLADLLARGLVTCDSFAAIRQMIKPPFAPASCAAAGRPLVLFPLDSAGKKRRRHDRDDRPAIAAPNRSRLSSNARAREDAHDLVGAAAGLSADGTARRNPRRPLRRRFLGRAVRAARGGRIAAPLAPARPATTDLDRRRRSA